MSKYIICIVAVLAHCVIMPGNAFGQTGESVEEALAKAKKVTVTDCRLFETGEQPVASAGPSSDDTRAADLVTLDESASLKPSGLTAEDRLQRVAGAYDTYIRSLRHIACLGEVRDEPAWVVDLVSYWKKQGAELLVMKQRKKLVDLTDELTVSNIEKLVVMRPRAKNNLPPDIIRSR